MAQLLEGVELLEAYCKATGKYGIAIFPWPDDKFGRSLEEIFKAAPYLTFGYYDEDTDKNGEFKDAAPQVIGDGVGFIICDTREEMDYYYAMTVGDDGPTQLNSYDGPCRIYAIDCSPERGLENENT